MNFKVILLPKADRDIEMHIKSGNAVLVSKIERQLEELKLHPRFGAGKPHRLKHKEDEFWSRRIDDRHRMLYKIDNNIVSVFVISLWGHYDDK